jgi:dihydropteroate synthase
MDSPRIMGIVNVTPDSFSDGGEHLEPSAAIEHARTLSDSGADFVDIGGESTRPGSEPVSAEEELRRILPVLSGLTGMPTPVSIDTRRPEVMREAAKIRADIINDVSALTFSPDSAATVAELKKPAVLMHAQRDPKTMQDNPTYRDVVIEVYDYLERRIEAAAAAGLSQSSLIADPGIGFGKTAMHNASVLQNISLFHGLGVPLLTGTSRKRSLQKLTGAKTPKEQVAGNIAASLDPVSQGVQIVRVHDVEETRQALAVWNWLRGAAKPQQRSGAPPIE